MDDVNEQTQRVERAMAAVPRATFLPPAERPYADEDAPLPIGAGQTNSQPYTVAFMLRLLDVRPGHRVLDLGAGSGWTTALLAHLAGPNGQVIGVERQESLIVPARQALAAHCRDAVPGTLAPAQIQLARAGTLGAPDAAPFDRILVSAEAEQLPPALLEQLADPGVMVIPVGTTMRRLERRAGALRDTEHGAFRFVPLIEE